MNTANTLQPWEIEMPVDRRPASFELHLGPDFFTAAGHADLLGGDVQAKVRLNPAADQWRIELEVEGSVQTLCDRCQGPMTARVADSYSAPLLPSPGGRVPAGDDSEALYYDPVSGVADLLRPLADTIALSLGLCHVHEPGECDPAVEAVLDHSDPEGATSLNTPLREALEALRDKSSPRK